MSLTDLIRKAQFVVDASGNKKAVLLDYEAWKELLTLLEDTEGLRSAASGTAKLRPFGLCAGDFTVPDDFNAPLPDYIIEEFEGR